MAKKKKVFDMDAKYSPKGVRIRDEVGILTREFRVRHPEEAKADDNKKN